MNEKEYSAYRNSIEWKQRAESCKARADYQCQHCFDLGPLHAHHLTYARIGHEWPEDLIALCGACHRWQHGIHQTNFERLLAKARVWLELPTTASRVDVIHAFRCYQKIN